MKKRAEAAKAHKIQRKKKLNSAPEKSILAKKINAAVTSASANQPLAPGATLSPEPQPSTSVI